MAWLSPLVPLVDSEELTDVQRLAMVVDSANGVGTAIDPSEFVFMNTDTSVHLHRFDRQGFIGTSAQTLLVQRR